MEPPITQSPSSVVSSVSHQLLFTILAKLDLPSLVAATRVDRTFSIVAQTLLHRRASWATMAGTQTTGNGATELTKAAKDAVQHTLLGRPTLGFLHTTHPSLFSNPVDGEQLARAVPYECTIIGAVVQQITTVSQTSSSSTYASNTVDDSSDSGKYSLSLASMGSSTTCVPFHISLATLKNMMASCSTTRPPNQDQKAMDPELIKVHLAQLSHIPLPSTCCAIVLMASIDSSNYLNMVTNCFQHKYAHVTIAGGLTPNQLAIVHGGQCFQYESGVVGVFIVCDVPRPPVSGKKSTTRETSDRTTNQSVVDCQVSRACVPATEVFTIGTTSGNSIHTLVRRDSNGSSGSSNRGGPVHLRAVDIVGQSIRDYNQFDTTNKRRMYFCGLSNNLHKGFHLCKIKGSLPNGSLVVDGETKHQTLLQIFALDADSSKDDLSRRLNILMANTVLQQSMLPSSKNARTTRTTTKAAARSVPNATKEVLGGLLFTCGGRGYKLYGEKAVEAKMFQSIFPSKGLSGMYGLGEIGPCVRAGAVDPKSNQGNTKEGVTSGPSNHVALTEIMGFTSVYVLFYASTFSSSGTTKKIQWTPTTLSKYAQQRKQQHTRVAMAAEALFVGSSLHAMQEQEQLLLEEELEQQRREQELLLEQMSHC
tara:strand:+ start:81 stop:2024 length:1944 start_codon:yes stop_codon:yes gene_type:complete